MVDDHPWHLFDAIQQLEVRRAGDFWEVRRVDSERYVRLTGPEFETLREGGIDAEIMARLDGAV